jgi:hypothetical protein
MATIVSDANPLKNRTCQIRRFADNRNIMQLVVRDPAGLFVFWRW